MPKKRNLRLAELSFQIIPVMLGVFLGFLVSNWSENIKNQSKADLFQRNLVAEIKSNRERLEEVESYHIQLLDSARHYSRAGISIENTDFFKGVQSAMLTNSAFDTGIQTGLINELPFEDIQLVNQTYTLQENYNEFFKLILTGLIGMDFDDSEAAKKRFFRFIALAMADIVVTEKELLRHYDKLLKEIESK